MTGWRVWLAHERVRAGSIAAAFGALGLVSRWLEPDPTGHGTHTQLGLFPCSFLTLTGIPCPLCGATTTFALFADGRWTDAILNQPFATFLATCCVVVFAVAAADTIQPRQRLARLTAWLSDRDAAAALIFLVAMFAGWTYKIAVMSNFLVPYACTPAEGVILGGGSDGEPRGGDANVTSSVGRVEQPR